MIIIKNYRGASIEVENDGSVSIYFAGNPYATRTGYKSIDDAKEWLDKHI